VLWQLSALLSHGTPVTEAVRTDVAQTRSPGQRPTEVWVLSSEPRVPEGPRSEPILFSVSPLRQQSGTPLRTVPTRKTAGRFFHAGKQTSRRWLRESPLL
jgi:hypothetical protein